MFLIIIVHLIITIIIIIIIIITLASATFYNVLCASTIVFAYVTQIKSTYLLTRPRWPKDRREGTVLMGRVLMPCFAPAAFSSEKIIYFVT